MYEDRKDRFSFRSFFLTLLLVLLFIFIMLWLFPTKSYLDDKLQSSTDIERLSVLYDEIFANNVGRMKDAAIGYFTNERMPKTIGESKKLTLQDMYDLHLILKLKDKDGNACDVKRSYTEMTKYTNEYRLKVNLSCGDYEDYIIVYLGCYDYCDGDICERRVETSTGITNTTTGGKDTSTTVNNNKKPSTSKPTDKPNTPSKPSTPEDNTKYYCKVVNGKYYDNKGNEVSKNVYEYACTTPVIKNYMYEYKLIIKGYSYWTEWSLWQKTSVTETSTREVETKEEKVISGYNTLKIQTGTRTYKVVTGTKEEKYQDGYTTELVPTTTKEPDGTKKVTTTEKVKTGEVYDCGSKIYSDTTIPSDTTTTHYEKVGSTTGKTCSTCKEETIYTYKVCSIEPVYEVKEVTKEVPVYKEVTTYTENQVPVYKTRIVNTYKTVTEPIYVQKTVPQYKTVKYYRYRDYIVVEGKTDVKWSYSKYDKELIEKKYVLTGNVKQV